MPLPKSNSFYLQLTIALFFIVFLFAPLFKLFTSINDESLYLFSSPEFYRQLKATLGFSCLASLIATIFTFALAYIITHTPIRWLSYLEVLLFIPLLTPSFFPALSLTYLLGSQGLLHDFFPNFSMQGNMALIICWIYYLLPSLYLIQKSGMKSIHNELYLANSTLRPRALKTFSKIIWPHTRLSALNSFLLGITLCVSDFGIAKVLGSNLPLFSMEIYKNVIGLQDYSLGSLYSLIIIFPALIHKIAEASLRRNEIPLSHYEIHCQRLFSLWKDLLAGAVLALTTLALVVFFLTPILVSFTKFWPYNREFTMDHYQFLDLEQSGFFYLQNSLILASTTAALGTLFSFVSSFFVEKNSHRILSPFLKWSFFIPLSLPGLALGIAYVLLFRTHAIWGTWTILVLNTFIHFCSTPFVAQSRAIVQLPHSYYQAAQSLRSTNAKILWRIYLPLCWPQLLSHFTYLFLNSLTTVSALIFLLPPSKLTASVAAVNLEDSGDLASATAITSLNVFAALFFLASIHLLQALIRKVLNSAKESSPVSTEPAVC